MRGTVTGTDPNGQPVAFTTVLARPHRATVTATLTQVNGTKTALPITGGSVTVDRGSAVRRSCQLEIAPGLGGLLIPADARSPLAPYGSLVSIKYGVDVPGLGTQTWQLGEYRVSRTSVQDDGAPTLRATAHDASRTISRNKLTQPWIVNSGTNYGAAIVTLLANRLPGLQVRAYSVSATTPNIVVDPEEDPWAVATKWATSFGSELYFDADGYLVIAPEPNPDTSPVNWTYTDGADSHIVSLSRELSDEPGYNGVVLTSESNTLSTPLRSEVWDTDPASPTYYLGPYGKVPKFVSSPYVATQAQADAAALAEFRRSVGGSEQLSLSVVPNPLLEVGDIIRAVRPLSKANQTTVVESITLPLAPGPMSLSCRARRVAQ